MTDILTRLREVEREMRGTGPTLWGDAADEIDRLRARLAEVEREGRNARQIIWAAAMTQGEVRVADWALVEAGQPGCVMHREENVERGETIFRATRGTMEARP